MNCDKIKKASSWVIQNACYYGIGLIGIFCNIHWAFNIFGFLTIIVTIAVSLLFLIALLKIFYPESDVCLPEFPVPLSVSHLCDAIMMLVLVANNHWGYAFLMLYQIAVLHMTYQKTNVSVSPLPPK